MQNIPLLSKTAMSTVRNIPDLIRFRNTSSTHRETIDEYSYDLWRRLMTQADFNDAARLGFLEFIDKWQELKEMIVKPLSVLQAIFYSIEKDQHDFYIKLEPLAGLVPGTDYAIAVLLGKKELAEALLGAGANPLTAIVHIPGGQQPYYISIYQLMAQWFMINTDNMTDDQLMHLGENPGINTLYWAADVPLIIDSISAGDLPLVKALIEHGADLKQYIGGAVDVWGPINAAFVNEKVELIHYLYPLVDISAERRLSITGSSADLYSRLIPNRRAWPIQTNAFDANECQMFVNAATTQEPGVFIENIVASGYIAYLPLAMLMLEQHKESLTSIQPSMLLESSLASCYQRYLGNTVSPVNRSGFNPLFKRMKELGYKSLVVPHGIKLTLPDADEM